MSNLITQGAKPLAYNKLIMSTVVDFVKVKVSIPTVECGRMDFAIRYFRNRYARKSVVNVKEIISRDYYTHYVFTFPNPDLIFEFGKLFQEIKENKGRRFIIK